MRERETLKDAASVTAPGREPPPVPGLALVFSVCQALSLALPVSAHQEVGRTSLEAGRTDERERVLRRAQRGY